MEKFETLHAVAAPLMVMNIDTDMIIPKQFLKTITRTGLGKSAFFEMRTNGDGSPNEDFILNNAPFNKANILVSGANFGCGSSREHAPWALKDFGFKVIIAESFADIFYNNCFNNGILPAITAAHDIEKIISYIENSEDKKITVNLETRTISIGKQNIIFQIDNAAANRLLKGLDTIGLTLEKEEHISAFEKKGKKQKLGYNVWGFSFRENSLNLFKNYLEELWP